MTVADAFEAALVIGVVSELSACPSAEDAFGETSGVGVNACVRACEFE